MAKAFPQKRWSILLGSVLGLTCASFLFAQVFDTKDIATVFDQDAYNEYKAREFAAVNDLIRQYEADLNWWMPIALPDTDRGWWKQGSFFSLSPFNPAGFSRDFVKNLVPVTREDVPVYPVSITENYFTRYREIFNANGALIASVPPPDRYNPRWFVYQNYPSLDSWGLSESRKAEMLGIYDQARLTVQMDLISDEDLVNLIMRRSVLAAIAAQTRQNAATAGGTLARSKLGGGAMAMMRSQYADAHMVVDYAKYATNVMTVQISYPNDFTNHLEVYVSTDLLASVWTVATTGLVTAGTNSLTWIDTNTASSVRKFYAAGDAQTDTDADGLPDAREIRLYQSDPNSMDSDADGLVDGYSGVVPTNAYPNGVTTNGGQFVEGELSWGTDPRKWDTDDDGMSDGWEVAHGHNPLDPNDPPNVRGTINYSGGQTGPVFVLAVETSDSWVTNHAVRLNGPGAYLIPNLTATNYWIKAFRDSNGDASNGLAEAWGFYSTNAITITNKVVGINLSLTDPDVNTNSIPDWWEIANFGSITNSGAGDDPDGDEYTNLEEYQAGTDPNNIASHPWNVSGTIAYAGPQTGTIWVVASATAYDWTWVRSTSIAQPGAYTITHLPPNTNYWIWAWRDTDGDDDDTYWEAWGEHAGNPFFLDGNITNIDLTLADPDSDGDGLPDWWEVLYGLDAFDGIRSDAAGWWKLDASSGTNVLDSSANANHGILWNATSNAWTSGVVSNGLRLDGTNDYVQLTNNTSLKPSFVSLALWMRPDRDYTNGSAAFFSKRVSGGSSGYSLGYENGKLAFTICASGAKTVQLSCTLSNGVWRHVAGTYGGLYQRLYVDGVLAVETNYNWGTGFGEIAQDAVNPRLGATVDTSPSNHFAGTLDDVLVFGQELSSNRVAGLYQAGADFDRDGLSNWREAQAGTCPTNTDTDADGLPDWWEMAHGLNPRDSSDASQDPDHDGLTNLQEYELGTDPHNPDTDGDGLKDGFEAGMPVVVTWQNPGATIIHTNTINAVDVAVGYGHSVARFSNGCLAAFGANDYGQTNVPQGVTNAVAVAAGKNHSLALLSDGRVLAWGAGEYGQTNVPPAVTNAVAISACGLHSLALLSNGCVTNWGVADDYWGHHYYSMEAPAGATQAVAIAAGRTHSLALQANGQVLDWGTGIWGEELPPPPIMTNAIAIAVGCSHGLALMADGSMTNWGYDSCFSPMDAPPAEATNTVAIAACDDYDLALLADGRIAVWSSWGSNGGPFWWWLTTTTGQVVTNGVGLWASGDSYLALTADGRVVGFTNWQQPIGQPPASFTACAVQGNGEKVGIVRFSSDPLNPDTDNDGMPDGWEVQYGLCPTNAADAALDLDNDEYTNLEEYQAGYDPTIAASHPWNLGGTLVYTGRQSGVVYVQICTSSNMLAVTQTVTCDVSGSFLATHLETNAYYWVRAWMDSQGGGTNDSWEAWGICANNPVYLDANRTNLVIALTDPDTDGDGLPDWWEIQNGFDPYSGMSTNLMAWWRFQEGAGATASDSSGQAHNGSLAGTEHLVWTNGSPMGAAMAFDGQGGVVTVPHSAALMPTNAFTVMAWVYAVDATNNYPVIVEKTADVAGWTDGWQIYVETADPSGATGFAFNVGNYGSNAWINSGVLITGRWVHVCGVYSNGTARLYVDGQECGNSAVPTPFAANSAPLMIGKFDPSDAYPTHTRWHGGIADVRFYDAALSSNAVAAMVEAEADADGDGLKNAMEQANATNPRVADTDQDGIPDDWEVAHGFDPLLGDSAREIIIQHWMIFYGTVPVFNNPPGSQADLIDMRDALSALSGKFYTQQ